MTTSMGNLVVNLSANIAEFNRNMDAAGQRTEQVMKKMDTAASVVKGVLGAVGVALSADYLVGEANRAIDSLAALDDMAQKTGSSVEILSRLGKVASMTGADFGSVDSILVKLSKNLNDVDENGNKTAKALGAIGISTADIKNMDPGQVFVQIANKLQGYEDGASKVALVTDLMGKSAADLLPYMNDVSENLEKFTGDSTKAAAEATKLQDQLGLMTVKYDEIKKAIVSAALPATNDFIEAIKEATRETNTLTTSTTITTWADDVALVMARIADGGSLVGRTFKAVNAELTATAANIELMDTISKNVNPIGAAKVLATGGSPTDNITAAMAKRDALTALAYSQIASLWEKPLDGYERAMQSRIAGRSDAAYMAGVDGLAGLAAPQSTRDLNYKGSDTKTTPGKGGKTAVTMPGLDMSPAMARMKEWAPDQGMAARMVEMANDETLAIQNTITATMDLQDAEQKRFMQQMRASEQNASSVEQIRQSLMTDIEAEQFAYEARVEQLRIFGETKLGSEIAANALIEQETARHERAKADMQRVNQLQSLGAMGDTADELYNLLKQSGEKQSGLAKAAFLASKAIAVAEIIVQTNLAASKAEGQLGIFGLPASAVILATGYSRAAMVAGTAIASAEGGYDIPAGVNPVTQLHEKEMVLPRAQAEVIRGLAERGGTGNSGPINHTVNITIDGTTDMAENRKMIGMAVAQGNADLVDRLQRAGRI